MDNKYYYLLLLFFVLAFSVAILWRPHVLGVDSYYFSNASNGLRTFNDSTPVASQNFFNYFSNDLKLVGLIVSIILILLVFLFFRLFTNPQMALLFTLFIFLNPFTLTQLIEFEDDLLGYVCLIPALIALVLAIRSKKDNQFVGWLAILGAWVVLANSFWAGVALYFLVGLLILLTYILPISNDLKQKIVIGVGLLAGILTMNINVVENFPMVAVLATFPMILIFWKKKLLNPNDWLVNVTLCFWFLGAVNSKFAFVGILLMTLIFVQQFGKNLFESVNLNKELLVLAGLTLMIVISIGTLAPTANDFDVLNQAKALGVKNTSWGSGYWFESIGGLANHAGFDDNSMVWEGLTLASKTEFSLHENCKLLKLNDRSLLDVGDCS